MAKRSREILPIQGTVGHGTNFNMTHYHGGEPLPFKPKDRLPCVRCGQPPTNTGADPCIAELPDVTFACCGHGRDGYVMFADRRTFRFTNHTGEAIRELVADHQHDTDPLPSGRAWDAGQ